MYPIIKKRHLELSPFINLQMITLAPFLIKFQQGHTEDVIQEEAPAKTYWTFLELFQNISDFFGPEHPELSLKCSITYQVHY